MSQQPEGQYKRIHPVVFPIAAGFIIFFVLFGAFFTETAGEALGETLAWVQSNFGWFFIFSVAAMVVFCLFLIIGPYGKIRLGPDESRPDYSYMTWFAMLFSAGMGIGLVFWGVAEPINHLDWSATVDGTFADRSATENAVAAQDAMMFAFHHWGLGPWAVYATLGLALAYFGYRHNLPLTVRSALYPLIGERVHGWIGNVVDILAVLGTMFGVATSLGLGVMQVNAGLTYVFGAAYDQTVQVWLIVGITIIATISVFTGLDKGIRILSQTNLMAAAALLVFVALVGPTVLLLNAYFQNLGLYVQNLPDLLFWSGAYGTSENAAEFADGWTVFYWAWWISWSPFVGMFIARISRGRTIREFTLGVLLVPTLVSFAWFTVMGNTGLHMQIEGITDMIGVTLGEDGDDSFAFFAMLEQLPLSTLTSIVAIIVIVIFFVTSSDSGSYVIDIIASGGNPDPPRIQRVFWSIAEGFVAAVLMLAGGEAALEALQAGAVSTGLPFTLVLIVVMIGLLKGLRSEARGVRMKDVPDEPLVGNGEDKDNDAETSAGVATKKED